MATFGPTLKTHADEFPADVTLRPRLLIEGAMAALDAGNGDEHDRLARAAAAGSRLQRHCPGAVQPGPGRRASSGRLPGLPVLTTPHSAVASSRPCWRDPSRGTGLARHGLDRARPPHDPKGTKGRNGRDGFGGERHDIHTTQHHGWPGTRTLARRGCAKAQGAGNVVTLVVPFPAGGSVDAVTRWCSPGSASGRRPR